MLNPEVVQVETKTILVSGHKMLVSFLTYRKFLVDDMDYARQVVGEAYLILAEQFLGSKVSAQQKSACVITNMTGLPVTQQIVETWFAQGSEQDVQTSRFLAQIFGKPVFQIMAIQNVNVVELNHRNTKLNTEANPSIYVNTLDEAVTKATELLRISHRL